MGTVRGRGMSTIHVQRRAFRWIARTVAATLTDRHHDFNAGAITLIVRQVIVFMG